MRPGCLSCQVEHTINEKNILYCIDFVFIVNMFDYFLDTKNLYFVLEFVNGGEMFTHIQKQRKRRFTEEQTRFFSAETVLAFEYLHNLDIIFRDLKPENMLIDHRGHVKVTGQYTIRSRATTALPPSPQIGARVCVCVLALPSLISFPHTAIVRFANPHLPPSPADFGFAKRVDDKTWTMCGTPEYLAPGKYPQPAMLIPREFRLLACVYNFPCNQKAREWRDHRACIAVLPPLSTDTAGAPYRNHRQQGLRSRRRLVGHRYPYIRDALRPLAV